MSEERTIHLRFADDVERQRYAALREQPGLHDVMSMGANLARDYVVPRIADGRATWRPGEIDRQIAGFLLSGVGDLEKQFGRALTEDEGFMLRKGYEGVALAAKDEHERMCAAGEKMGEGLALALAGVEACNAGLALLGIQSPAPVALPAPAHALSRHVRRRLRPEDLGPLPMRH